MEVRHLPSLPATAPLYARLLLPRRATGSTAPERTVVVTGHRTDLSRLVAYNRVCGFPLRDRLPATWLHVLGFGLQLELLADPEFPVGLAGVVHAANRITQHRPVGIGEALTLSARTAALRAHPRGVMIDLASRAEAGGDLVWEGTSSYLSLGARLAGLPAAGPEPEAAPGVLTTAGFWRLPADLGRRYAAVSGDVNPIHLSRATAMMFGFRRPIIHGMWTHARVLAALEAHLPESFTAAVRFRRPIALPGGVRFAVAVIADGYQVAVTTADGSKDYLTASVG
jgi:acyl dehydratase